MFLPLIGILEQQNQQEQEDPYAANVVLFLKTDHSLLTTNTTTAANFTVPAINSTATVDVASSSFAAANRAIRVGNSAGNYIITAIPNGTQLTIKNCGGSDNAIPGTIIASGATIALSIIDSSQSPKNINAFGNVQLSSDGKLLFDGSIDCLFVSPNSDFGYGTGDLTIEGYFTLNNTATQTIFSHLTNVGSVAPHFYYQDASGTRYYTDGADRINGGALVANTEYHIAISKVSGITRVFVNGVQSGSSYTDEKNYGTTNPFVLGDYGNPRSQSLTFNGKCRKFRITKGIGRYTATFNPSISSYL